MEFYIQPLSVPPNDKLNCHIFLVRNFCNILSYNSKSHNSQFVNKTLVEKGISQEEEK
jgi:hypothetical protein